MQVVLRVQTAYGSDILSQVYQGCFHLVNNLVLHSLNTKSESIDKILSPWTGHHHNLQLGIIKHKIKPAGAVSMHH